MRTRSLAVKGDKWNTVCYKFLDQVVNHHVPINKDHLSVSKKHLVVAEDPNAMTISDLGFD